MQLLSPKQSLWHFLLLAKAMFVWTCVWGYPTQANAAQERIFADVDDAIQFYKVRVDADPNDTPDLYLLGLAYYKKKDDARALATLQRYTQLVPTDDDGYYTLGLLQMRTGQPALAVTSYSRALIYNPDNSEILFDLGLAELAQNHWPQAQDAFTRVTEKKPDFAPAFYNLGLSFERQFNFPRALAAYDMAEKLDPKQDAPSINKAKIFATQGHVEQAIDLLRNVLQSNTQDAIAWYNLGVLLGQEEQWSEAITAYQNVIAYAPKQAEAYNNLGIIYERLQDPVHAQQAFASAVNANPNFADARYNLGLALFRAGEDAQAFQQFQRVLQLKPRHHDALLYAAQISAAHFDLKQSVAYYRQASEDMPEDAVALRALGDVYLRDHQFVRAEKIFEQIQKNATQADPTLLGQLGLSLSGQKKFDAAIRFFRQAVAQDSANLVWERYLVQAMCDAQRTQEALAEATHLVQQIPDQAMAWVILATVHRVMGRLDLAEVVMLKARDLDGSLAAVYLELGYISRAKHDAKQARLDFLQAAKRAPRDLDILVQLASAQYDTGATQEALRTLQRALQIDPNTAEAYYWLGFVEYKLGHRGNAIDAFEQAIRLAPEFCDAYFQLGRVLLKQGRIVDAQNVFEIAAQRDVPCADAANALQTLRKKKSWDGQP